MIQAFSNYLELLSYYIHFSRRGTPDYLVLCSNSLINTGDSKFYNHLVLPYHQLRILNASLLLVVNSKNCVLRLPEGRWINKPSQDDEEIPTKNKYHKVEWVLMCWLVMKSNERLAFKEENKKMEWRWTNSGQNYVYLFCFFTSSIQPSNQESTIEIVLARSQKSLCKQMTPPQWINKQINK